MSGNRFKYLINLMNVADIVTAVPICDSTLCRGRKLSICRLLECGVCEDTKDTENY